MDILVYCGNSIIIYVDKLLCMLIYTHQLLSLLITLLYFSLVLEVKKEMIESKYVILFLGKTQLHNDLFIFTFLIVTYY